MEISENDVTSSSPVAPATSKDAVASTSTSNRRKSGRATRAPQKFVPESTNESRGNTKRKRGETEDGEESGIEVEENGNGNDAMNEVASDEEESEENEGDESAGEEESRNHRRVARAAPTGKSRAKSKAKEKKPVAKKVKTNGAVAHDKEVEKPAKRALPKKKGAESSGGGKAVKITIADKDATGLYAELYSKSLKPNEVAGLCNDIASQWVNRFHGDGPAALAEMVNFVLKSAGCSSEVTTDHIDDPDNISSRIQDLQDEFQTKEIVDYPLISKATASAHAFRRCLTGFIAAIVEIVHETSLMYNNRDLIESITQWIGSMSSSTSRPFRHTATVVALTITSAMCKIAKTVNESTAMTQRMLEAEKKEKKNSANKARLADLQKRVTSGMNKKEYVEERLKDVFEMVYLNRYRDVDPKIRIECIEALGQWIRQLPSYWLEGQYLRYMGWMLSDSTPLMRQKVIEQLDETMENEQNASGMRHFLERFRPRLVEMATQDAEPSVRAAAVTFLDKLRNAGMMEPDEIDVIGRLIYDSEPKVREAVANFFIEILADSITAKVEQFGDEETLNELLNDGNVEFDMPHREWIDFKSLAELLMSYDSEDQSEMPSQTEIAPGEYLIIPRSDSRYTLATKALFSKLEVIRKWDMLAGYLLYDHSAKAIGNEADDALNELFKPEEQEEVILLEMLNAAVELILTEAQTKESKKGKSQQEGLETKENTARRLADFIPRLLKRYGATPRTATVVLRLENALNLRVFQDLRQESTVYAKLLDEISAQFRGHGDKAVLSSAGAALLHAQSYPDLKDVTETKVESLWDDTLGSLRKINGMTESMAVRGSLSLPVLTELANTVARLERLASITNCVEQLDYDHEGPAIDILLDIVARGEFTEEDVDIDHIEDDLALAASRTILFFFMWKVRDMTSNLDGSKPVPELEVNELVEKQAAFANNLITGLSSRSTLDRLRLGAAGTLLDLHVLFMNAFRPTVTAAMSKHQRENNVADGLDLGLGEHTSSSPYAPLIQSISSEVQTETLNIFVLAEKQYAKKANKPLLSAADAADTDADLDLAREPENESDEEPEEPEEPEDEELEEDDAGGISKKKTQLLNAERQLCEFAGKMVLAILASVIDEDGDSSLDSGARRKGKGKGKAKDVEGGKIKKRLQRNRDRLGPNFKEVIAYLYDSEKGLRKKAPPAFANKQGGKKSHKSKGEQKAINERRAEKGKEKEGGEEGEKEQEASRKAPARKAKKSQEVVLVSDDDEEDDDDNEEEEVDDERVAREEDEAEENGGDVMEDVDQNGHDDDDQESLLGD